MLFVRPTTNVTGVSLSPDLQAVADESSTAKFVGITEVLEYLQKNEMQAYLFKVHMINHHDKYLVCV